MKELNHSYLMHLASVIYDNEWRLSDWLENAIRKQVKRGIKPQAWYLANCSTVRTMYREQAKRFSEYPRMQSYESQLIRKYLSDMIIANA